MGKADGGLRNLFKKHLKKWHWQHMESGGTGGGIPDTNYCYQGVEGWIECKKTETESIRFRAEQVAWIDRRCREGGRVFIAVRRKHDGGSIKGRPVDELWLYHGIDVRALNTHGMNPLWSVNFWWNGPRKWDWDQIAAILLAETSSS